MLVEEQDKRADFICLIDMFNNLENSTKNEKLSYKVYFEINF